MKKPLICALAAAILPVFSCAGEKYVLTEERRVDPFDAIDAKGSFDVEYAQSETYLVLVEGDEECVPSLVTESIGGTLYLHMDDSRKWRNVKAKVIVYAPDVIKVSMSGSGDYEEEGLHMSPSPLVYTIAGSGDIELESIQCQGLDVKVSGSGEFSCKKASVKGETNVAVLGSGDAEVKSFDGQDVYVSIKGSGDVTMNGKAGKVDVIISGSGSVEGRLRHQEFTSRVSGSGKVTFK